MKLIAFIALLMGLTIIAAGGLGVWGVMEWRAPGPAQADTMVVIEKGQGVAAIARTLKEANVIRQPVLFRAIARVLGRQADLKAGEYQFMAHESLASVIDKIARGEIFLRRFTVPEGYTSWQALQVIGAVSELTGDLPPVPAEGSLLPQTYNYMRGDAKQAAVQQMQDAMKAALAELWTARDINVPLKTPEEAVVLASIVEKETGVPAERAKIAALFENRLRRNMPLQSDPTVIYALTNGQIQQNGQGPLGRHLLSKDLETDSPYNTYKYPGLPPGPIANPGRDALTAVLHPEANDYLYFVADGTGGHVFARTLDEHNANVAKWRDIRSQQDKAAPMPPPAAQPAIATPPSP